VEHREYRLSLYAQSRIDTKREITNIIGGSDMRVLLDEASDETCGDRLISDGAAG
jgi:hypothetical protein